MRHPCNAVSSSLRAREKIYLDDIFGSRPDLSMISGHRYVISTVYESDNHREISNEIYEKILALLTVLRLFKPGNLQYGTIRNLPLSWTSGCVRA